MSGPGYVFKNSGTTPPAVDDRHQDGFTNGQLPPKARFNGEINDPDLNKVRAENGEVLNGTAELQSQSEVFPESISRINPAPILQEKTEVLKREFAPGSQEVASQDHELRGAAQLHLVGENDNITRDVGWHKHNDEIPDPLIGGISNGDLFAMIRRFNKVCVSPFLNDYH
jgi:hypothetical protein